MDPSRFKRRQTQIRRPTPNVDLGVSDFVPRVDSSRARTVARGIAPAAPVASIAPTPAPESRPAVINIPVALPETQIDDSKLEQETMPHLLVADMDLPGQPSLSRAAKTVVHGRRLRGVQRWALRGVVAMLVLVIGTGGLLFSQGYFKLHKVFKGGVATAAALTPNVNPSLLKGEGDGRVNVLMLGRGGGNHDGPDLTDTMMLASIDPVNHTTTLISIPRDLWVDVPNQGAMKINAVWETGEFKYLGKIAPGSTDPNAIAAGFNEVDQTVESVMGVTIDYNAIVDFAAFQQAVNTVNGVTVDVPTDLVDPTMAWENHGSPLLAKAGIDTFNGMQALTYVRSRETTSDFARAQRQRAVLVALKGKVDTLGTLSNPLKIAGLLNAFGNNVQTDLSLSDATRLYSIIKGIGQDKINSVGMAGSPNNYITTGTMGNQSIDLPVAGLFNYSAIQNFVRTQLPDGYILKENAKVLVLNGTDTPGLATSFANELKSYGYNVVGAANAPGNGWTQTTLVDLNKSDIYTDHYLEQRLNVTSTNTMPDETIQTNGADFVIIIGSDEATTLQTQAN
jgi:LCP family protein required for cell wall assembly